jgi:hypothetical protein
MVVPFRSLAVFSLAFGMLAAGYLIGPAPGATALPSSPAAAPAPKVMAVPEPLKPVPALVANRPPVPIVGPQHANYFATAIDPASATTGDKPTADAGTSTGNPNPSDPSQAQPGAQTQTAALTSDQSGVDADARKAIEFDGYRNVSGIVKDADGVWHARAMRGRTEIAVTVDASGNVSAQ